MAFLPEYVLPVYVYSVKWLDISCSIRCRLTSSPVNDVAFDMAQELAERLRSSNYSDSSSISVNYEGCWENVEIFEREYRNMLFQGANAESNDFNTASTHPELIKILKSSSDERIVRFVRDYNL